MKYKLWMFSESQPKLHLLDLLWICCVFVLQLVVQQIRNRSHKWNLGFNTVYLWMLWTMFTCVGCVLSRCLSVCLCVDAKSLHCWLSLGCRHLYTTCWRWVALARSQPVYTRELSVKQVHSCKQGFSLDRVYTELFLKIQCFFRMWQCFWHRGCMGFWVSSNLLFSCIFNFFLRSRLCWPQKSLKRTLNTARRIKSRPVTLGGDKGGIRHWWHFAGSSISDFFCKC